MLAYILIISLSYFLGNISNSYLISRFIFNKDIRHLGSKNPGTTNAIRTLGKKACILTFIGDFLKGTISVILSILIANKMGVDISLAKYIALVASVCGHNWPVLLKFKGGKGVATTYGAMAAISPLMCITCAIFFSVVALVTRYVSVASILSICLFPVLMYITEDFSGVWICMILSIIIIYRHKANLLRLWKGEENSIDSKKKL